MRLNLNLPDWPWTEQRGIFIMGGVEPVASCIYPYAEWKIKTGRCSQCGKCCEGLRDSPEVTAAADSFPLAKDGACTRLIPDGLTKKVCSLGNCRPWVCGIATPNRAGCTLSYSTTKV